MLMPRNYSHRVIKNRGSSLEALKILEQEKKANQTDILRLAMVSIPINLMSQLLPIKLVRII